MSKKAKIFLITISIAVIIAAFLFIQISKAQEGLLKVWFFDVGQGDSAFIKTPKGIDILIDGGPDRRVLENLGKALPFWDRDIDLVILTHPHADHVNGLIEVLKRYKVEKILEPGFKYNTASYSTFENLIEQKNIKKETVEKGQEIVLEDGIAINIFWPEQPLNNWVKDINDISAVAKLSYEDIDFLFTGDIGIEVEKKILQNDLTSEFLKVGHHGSRYSSAMEFLDKVRPLISIISSGKGNSYGHPHKETIERLGKIGSKILRTDESGYINVEIEKDGDWKVACEKSCY